MKAKDLDENLFPRKEVVKAYEAVDQDYPETITDRVYAIWYSKVRPRDASEQNNEIEERINQMHRVKDSRGEWLTYDLTLHGKDWEGNTKDFYYREGIIEGYPEFEKKIDPETKKVKPAETHVHETRTIYTIPFTKAKVNELSKYFTGSIQFHIMDKGTGGRTYTCKRDEFTDLTYEELLDLKIGFMDYMRNKRPDHLQKPHALP